MTKYKIEEEVIYGINNGYYVLVKNNWWSRWKYIKNAEGLIVKHGTRRGAQAYINMKNLQAKKKQQ